MKVAIKDFLEHCLFNNGNFCRIDIPIRVMAVEDFARCRKINNLWWRMQYAKLWFLWGKNDIKDTEYFKMIDIQKQRMTNMVAAFDHGDFLQIPLTVGSNFALKDGSHRLSCHIYYKSKEVPLEMLKTPYYKPDGIDCAIKQLYTDDEWIQIITYKNNLLEEYDLL